MVKLTGALDGSPVEASGFVVAIRPDDAEVYIATSAALARASQIRIAFAVDREHTFPARMTRAGFNKENDVDGIALFLVDSAGPEKATVLELASSVPPHSRSVEVVAAGGQAPQTVVRQYLGRNVTASFYLNIEGSLGPEFLGGPVLFDGKVGGVVIKSTSNRSVAYAAEQISTLLAQSRHEAAR